MKIVHILHSLRGGGIQNFLLSLASEQANTKDWVYVIVIDSFDSDYCYHLKNTLCRNNVKVYQLNKIRHNKTSLIKTLVKCRLAIKKIKPDIVNTHSEIGHFYGRMATIGTSIPQVITIHNTPENWNPILKLLCKNKPLIFCSQAAFQKRIQNSYTMTAIDNGISRNIIHNNEFTDLRKEFHLSPDDKIIISVGSLRPQKNYIFIKKIVDQLDCNNYHFFICGGGATKEYNNELQEMKRYKNIHFLGLRKDISAIENKADLFLSCAQYEGLPIAVLEAYFNGMPCVLSPIEQHIKISDVDYVWIPKSFTPKSFIECIKNAINLNLDHDEIYEKRKEKIAYYSIQRTVKEYDEFYRKIIHS